MTGTWGRRLFRAAAIVLVLLGAAHSLSFFNPPVPQNDTERQLFNLADNYKFNLMGSPRSMSDLMRGFSISFMLAAFVVGAINLALWSESHRALKRAAFITTTWLAVMTAVSLAATPLPRLCRLALNSELSTLNISHCRFAPRRPTS